ncbi:glycine--tRNA ligase subunit beta [Brackiella oedipodis]|uniref:glycine--tRNA ligase subunit beta n=1 Tax=Brackiella oedipodis TaxID=124225 RepID=UPI00048B1A08|nr:glycine--tRNA ligase subunit beta [Brackiella oedipodis]
MTTNPLLIELVTEELPPKALRKLGQSFATSIIQGLQQLHLVAEDSQPQYFATPRRLAVHIPDVLEQAPEQSFTEKLMPKKVALTAEGEASPALLKKLAAKNLSHLNLANLETENDGKQDFLIAKGKAPGAQLAAQIEALINKAIEQLPIPKMMRYQLADGHTTVKFVRPAHSLIVLHGAEVLPANILGIDADNLSFSHRFLGKVRPKIKHADAYAETLLQEGKVIASYDERKQRIREQLLAAAQEYDASIQDQDPEVQDLLEEVTSLVEYPCVYVGQFEEKFLQVPQECLILTMRLNQKYFPLFNRENGKLLNKFLIVSNMEVADPSNIIEGNERVVRPRLADAEFFFTTDLKESLEHRMQKLSKVVYQNQLGSQLERTARVQKIAVYIAQQIGAKQDEVARAAAIAKNDLSSSMVGEFPELQGIMAAYYAKAQQEPEGVIQALAQQYATRFVTDIQSTDDLTAIALYIAERTETLIGIWGVGLIPSGERDPYALRRAALGIISASEKLQAAQPSQLAKPLDIQALLDFAATCFGDLVAPHTAQEVFNFILERYRNQLSTDYDKRTIDAVLAKQPPLDQIPSRLAAVSEFANLPAAQNLAAANKRISNLLKKVDDALPAVDPALLQAPAEQALYKLLQEQGPKAVAAFDAKDFSGSLQIMAQFADAVDTFFADVMVMSDDERLKHNRLALLQALHHTMNLVADISGLVV